MDLRVKRTLLSIKDAFYFLRKRKPIDKISVKELSELAMINKATFYLHYKDIYDLSEKLKENLIKEIIVDVSQSRLTKNKESYEEFIGRLNSTIFAHKEDIEILFSHGKSKDFADYLEDSIMEYIFTQIPEYKNDLEKHILISYMVHGSYHIITKTDRYPRDLLYNLSIKYSQTLLEI